MFDEEIYALAAMAVNEFGEAGMHIATAESCTGGLISSALTAVAGSSNVFDRGFVTYSNDAKRDLLNVSAETLDNEGAVSAECASQMATGALQASGCDAAVAVTGIAGPGGGSPEKPVGLVFIAVATAKDEGAFVEKFEFGDPGRDQIRRETVIQALEMLLGYGIDEEE